MLDQEFGEPGNPYASYAPPRQRKLDSRGLSRNGTSVLDEQPVFKVQFLGSQLMGKDEPDPELVIDLIANLVGRLDDVRFRPRNYTVQLTDSEVIICEQAADWTEKVPLRVIHFCMQGNDPYSNAFGFVARAKQGFMGHVFLARNTNEAQSLKRSFYFGFERAFQQFEEKQVAKSRPRQPPPVERVPFVERPYGAPSYNAYYRYYPKPQYRPQQQLRPPPQRRYISDKSHPVPIGRDPMYHAAATGQPYSTRYYIQPNHEDSSQHIQQSYRRHRPLDTFLHEYEWENGRAPAGYHDHYPERVTPTYVRTSRPVKAPEDIYRTVDRRQMTTRLQTPLPAPRRQRQVLNDDMIY